MPKVSFDGRYDRYGIKELSEEVLEDIFIRELPIGGKWGDATIKYQDGAAIYKIIVLADETHGFYLKYIDSTQEEFMSIADRSKLTEVICPDDWEVSVGLFLDREHAYKVLLDFIKNGKRSDTVEWIQEDEMPKDSCW